jgi:hypothetical protein
MSPDEMRWRAKRYRTMAIQIGDPWTVEVLHELADEYEASAAAIEARETEPDGEAS